jgi:hypothetical protein
MRDYLNGRASSAGDAARAHAGVPDPRPARFIRLQLAGATVTSLAHRDCRMVVECWEKSEHEAERLADLVVGWLAEMDTNDGHVPAGPDGWLGGPYSQPDPDSGTPRYVTTVILRQRIQ